jgi:hypothetical protein
MEFTFISTLLLTALCVCLSSAEVQQEIYHCGDAWHSAVLSIRQLSSGESNAIFPTRISVCYDRTGLQIAYSAEDQKHFHPDQDTDCNSDIYNLSVLEFFLGPLQPGGETPFEDGPFCYSELDVNPFATPYQSGIFNPYRNASSFEHTLLNCSSTGVAVSASIGDIAPAGKGGWQATMTVPWHIANCPAGCPKSKDQSDPERCTSPARKGDTYRANFYRIAQLSALPEGYCCSGGCEYSAWSPTLAVPPAFHEPTHFGTLVIA